MIQYIFDPTYQVYLLRNDSDSLWIDKYNDVIIDYKSGLPHTEGPFSSHHIIPRSIAPELSNDKNNIISITISDHMMLHYYLWKEDPAFARQLWFGCVWCRKNGLWDLPGGDEEYEELKKSLKRNKK